MDAGRDQLIKLEPAIQVEIDKTRHVLAEPVGAHVRALQLLLEEKLDSVDLDVDTERDHADDGGGPTLLYHREGLFGGLLQADRLEGVVHAAPREGSHHG